MTTLRRCRLHRDVYSRGPCPLCAWATERKIRASKKSQWATPITIGGRTLTRTAWCRELGVNLNTYNHRRQRGYTPIAALQPVKRGAK